MSAKRSSSQQSNQKPESQQPVSPNAVDGLGSMGGQRPNPQLLEEIQSEVSTEAAPLLQFILKHAILIMACLGLFVVILAGIGGYNWYAERNLLEGQAKLSSIVLSNQGEERVKALESFLTTAPTELKGGTILALAEVSMELKNYDKAAEHYGALAALDSQGAVGLLAALNQGQALLLAGKAKQAVDVLESIVNKPSTVQRVVIQQALAEAALQAGDVEKARQTYEAMVAAGQGPEERFFRYRARTAGNESAALKPEQAKDTPSATNPSN